MCIPTAEMVGKGGPCFKTTDQSVSVSSYFSRYTSKLQVGVLLYYILTVGAYFNKQYGEWCASQELFKILLTALKMYFEIFKAYLDT